MPRLNSNAEVARDDRGAAVCGWLDVNTCGPYQKDTGGDRWALFVRHGTGIEERVQGLAGGCNAIASADGLFMRRLDGASPELAGNVAWQPSNGRVGDMDGNIAVVLDSEMVVLSVYVNAVWQHEVRRGTPFGGLRLKGQLACWVEFTSPVHADLALAMAHMTEDEIRTLSTPAMKADFAAAAPRVTVRNVITNTPVAVDVIGPAQYSPVAFEHAGEQWVLYQTDASGGLLHKATDKTVGYRFGTPKSVYDPDVIMDGNRCVVCWSDDEGQFKQGFLDIPVLGAGMVPLPQEQVETPAPPTPVPPPPPPPPETKHMDLHPAVISLFKRFLTVFPVPNGAAGSEEHFTAMRQWVRRFCEQVRHDFPDGMPGVGGEFGWKRASTGRPESKESLALKTADGLVCWDLFTGVGTGNPQADFTPGFHDIWNPPEGPQVFIPVTPTNHLGGAQVTPPTPGRATLSGTWCGKSGFNLLERTPAEREAWLTAFGPGVVHRVMLARTKRVNGQTDMSWTPEDGVAQLPSLLDLMRKHKCRIHLTLHCDTKLYGRTKDDVRRVTRLAMEALAPYGTDVVASVQGFNEPVHSTQQDYCADEAFNAELDAMIPLRFPYTWGATTHGGHVGSATHGTIHGDRSLTPEENAAHAAELMRVYGRPFLDDEPLGIDETEQPGRRTNDPDFARRLAQAAKDHGLPGATLHTEAGLTADITKLGPVHREAWARFRAVLQPDEGVPGGDGLARAADRAAREAMTDLYRELLGRAPDPEGLAFYVKQLRSGAMTIETARAHMMSGDEYRGKHG